MNSGHPLPSQEVQHGKLTNGPVIDHRSCDFEFDLIVQLPPSEKIVDLSQTNLFGCLPTQLAGGVMSSPMEGSYGQCDFYRQCDIHENLDTLSQALAKLPTYARIIASDSTVPDKKKFVDRLSNQAVFPIGSGFSFLGEPQERSGIEGFLHVFAEPVMSLVKLRQVHSIKPLENSLWSLVTSNSAIEVSA